MPTSLTNRKIEPSRQALHQGECLPEHWGGENGPQRELCPPPRGLPSNGKSRIEGNPPPRKSTHQPITVTERHGGGFRQACHVPNVEAGPKQRLHPGVPRLALPLHGGPRSHEASVGPQPQVQVSAENGEVVEEASSGVLSVASGQARGLARGGSAGSYPRSGRLQRHHVGHQAALGVSAHRHRQDALGSAPRGPACNGKGR